MDGFIGAARGGSGIDARQGSVEPAGFDFPRLSGLLDRMTGPSQVAAIPVEPIEEAPVMDASAMVGAPDRAEEFFEVEAYRADVLPSFEDVLRDGFGVAATEPDGPDEVEQMIERMQVRDIAREALRARLIAFGEGRQHRSTYESVFIMLAFAVMVLLSAPPIVDILLAAHGVRPG